MDTKKPTNIKDVARVAGVSIATVSRALSSPEMLTENTRETVLRAIRDTGYRANRSARNLRKQSAGAALILVPDLKNPFFSEILAGLNNVFRREGLSVLVTDTSQGVKTHESWVDYFLDGRIDGMVSLDGALSPSQLEEFEKNNVMDRIVFACEWIQGEDLPSIRSDNAKGARLAIRHLYELGHRKIAHITGPAGNVLTEVRREAMLAERSALALPMKDEWVIRGDFSLESGTVAARKLVEMEDRPTAVFCASDMIAFGLIFELEKLGLKVPQDISVVGFDDIEMAAFSRPSLTTIRQNRTLLGARAAEHLSERLLTGAAPKDTKIELIDVELVVRESTAPLAGTDA